LPEDTTTFIHDPPPARTDRFGPLRLTAGVDLTCLGESRFLALVVERALGHSTESQWTTSASTLDTVLPYALSTACTARVQSALIDLQAVFGEHALALVSLRGGRLHARVAAAELSRLDDIERWLRDALPALLPSERHEAHVRFWTCAAHGASSASRTISVPTFAEIEQNYPRAVRERLRRLAAPAFRPTDGGQLILWYGPPGTGKTYALRALAWEWRAWCELHYMIDPEVFFGHRADYMVEVLLENDDLVQFDEARPASADKWRLLVLEDTGELLAADAKERTGQGLSRMLNLVDGIVGQGLRVLVLVTTNEQLRRLHPAVSRPGRCAARVQFEPFSAEEARAWLERHGVADSHSGSATLADLFALRDGREVGSETAVGFRA
jgi:hypothetical protein